MTARRHNRQLGIIDPRKLDLPIAIIGAGGIGSWTTLALTRMGCSNITVIDFDKVEAHNVGSQIFTEEDIGKPKVEALAGKIALLASGEVISTLDLKVEKDSPLLEDIFKDNKIIILAVDNMETRKMAMHEAEGKSVWLIDGRMVANSIEIYSEDCAKYSGQETPIQKSMFQSGNATPVPCTERAVVYNCFIMAGLITDMVGQIVNGQEPPQELVVDLRNFTMHGGLDGTPSPTPTENEPGEAVTEMYSYGHITNEEEEENIL